MSHNFRVVSTCCRKQTSQQRQVQLHEMPTQPDDVLRQYTLKGSRYIFSLWKSTRTFFHIGLSASLICFSMLQWKMETIFCLQKEDILVYPLFFHELLNSHTVRFSVQHQTICIGAHLNRQWLMEEKGSLGHWLYMTDNQTVREN